MPKYIVRKDEHIVHDNKEYNGGDTITLTEEQAKALRVDPVEAPKDDGRETKDDGRGTKDDGRETKDDGRGTTDEKKDPAPGKAKDAKKKQ